MSWHHGLPEVPWPYFDDKGEPVWPEFHEFEDVIGTADRVEIWTDGSVNDRIWRWYLAAELDHLGVPQDRISD
ncbi:MAG: hypothetical protein P8P56_08280 [Yoonia sp.]|nr:hypothetical protein [Yoonia sp.]MDG1863121.1 hypothetical protein [Yoonia sp.]